MAKKDQSIVVGNEPVRGPTRLGRPRVVSWMLQPEGALDHYFTIPDDKGGLVWVYANNVGHRKAREVHIDTNIPRDAIQDKLWSDGSISSKIVELDPDIPVCIGVLSAQKIGHTPHDALWIRFSYLDEDNESYNEMYELEI